MRNIKRILALIIMVACTLAIVSCNNKPTDIPEGMQLATNEFVSYKLFVPDTWNVDKNSGFISAYNPEDKTNVSVMTQTGTKVYSSVSEYIDEYIKTLSETYAKFELIEEECTQEGISLSGRAAARVVFKITQSGVTYKCQQLITSSGYYIFTLTYTANAEMYDKHLDDLSKIIKYFELI